MVVLLLEYGEEIKTHTVELMGRLIKTENYAVEATTEYILHGTQAKEMSGEKSEYCGCLQWSPPKKKKQKKTFKWQIQLGRGSKVGILTLVHLERGRRQWSAVGGGDWVNLTLNLDEETTVDFLFPKDSQSCLTGTQTRICNVWGRHWHMMLFCL